MNLKAIVSAIILVISVHKGCSQILACGFRNDSSHGYTCDLLLYNPTGSYNFSRISGTHLPGKTNDDVRYVLRTTDSNSTNFPSIICDTFQNTRWIDLPTINIEYIDETAFVNCKKLEYLNLNFNKITKIDEKLFNENKELKTLYLNSNQLITLPENIFTNQQKITNLDLRNNLIEDLPRNVFKTLKHVSILYLDNNKLKVIHAFGFSSNLTRALLSNNQIEAFDQNFIDDTGVTYLDMKNNLCANVSINDTSLSRLQMRMLMVKCFDNYMNLVPDSTTTSIATSSSTTEMTLPPECSDGDLDERVCRIENEKEELYNNLKSLTEAFADMETRMTDVENRPCACV